MFTLKIQSMPSNPHSSVSNNLSRWFPPWM